MDRERALALLKGGHEGAAEFNRIRYQGGPSLNLAGADLSGVEFGALINLRGVHLLGVSLRGARLRVPDLRGANLYQADLRECELFEASFTQASLMQADLRGALLYGTELVDTALSGANLAGAKFGYTVVASDLGQVVGLETVVHQAPSFITIDALRSKTLPVDFLRGCGLLDEEIEGLRPSVSQHPVPRSCFICYSTEDENLATQLYDDLQQNGVRCWKWDVDARVGRALLGEINTAIRSLERVLLIASEASLRSPAVLREVERALQLEDERHRMGQDANLLFPIRTDNYLFDGWTHPRRPDVISKFVGDATEWRNPQKYEVLLTRLLRDLKH